MTFIQCIFFGQSYSTISASQLNRSFLFPIKVFSLARNTLSCNALCFPVFSALAICLSSDASLLLVSSFLSEHNTFFGGVFPKQESFLINAPTLSNYLPLQFSHASEQRTFTRHTLEPEPAPFPNKNFLRLVKGFNGFKIFGDSRKPYPLPICCNLETTALPLKVYRNCSCNTSSATASLLFIVSDVLPNVWSVPSCVHV